LQAFKSRAGHAGTGGGAVVETGTKEFAGQLHHEQPLIHCSGTAVIILYGFLSNLDELFKRIDADSCSGTHAYSFGDGGSLSSRRFYSQSHAAEALLEVYLQTKASDLLIMLSELQVALCMLHFASAQLLHVTLLQTASATFIGAFACLSATCIASRHPPQT